METNVLLKAKNKIVTVEITDSSKPDIDEVTLNRWQRITDILADILDVPAALIMKITPTHMEVFLRSQNIDNPYLDNGKDPLLQGLYCETVISTDTELIVKNALMDKVWKTNPDIEINMISYYGLPIKWRDGTIFGTICSLDNKPNEFIQRYRKLLRYFQEIIEQDLNYAEQNKLLEEENLTDTLTNVGSRRKFEKVSNIFLYEYHRYKFRFCIVVMEIDNFNEIHDVYGHSVGDEVLIRFSKYISKRIRITDLFTRNSGHMFVLILKEIAKEKIDKFMEQILVDLNEDSILKTYNVTISYGVSFVDDKHKEIQDLMKEAEKDILKKREIKRPLIQLETINTILQTLFEKDPISEIHSRVVADLGTLLAKKANLKAIHVNQIGIAGLFHDIGKIIIPSDILKSKDILSKQEYEEIKKHSQIGYRILRSVESLIPISDIVLSHHERIDGKGYPNGIKGDQIPIEAKVISICDSFDAMMSKRHYRESLGLTYAINEIKKNAGSQFDKELAKIFINEVIPEIKPNYE